MKLKIGRIAFWIVIFISWILTVSFVMMARAEASCKSVKMSVIRFDDSYFIKPADVQKVMDFHYDSLKGLSIKEINIDLLEESIEGLPFVARAEVYSSIDCELRIDVYQRQAKARVLADQGSFYLDENGNEMPLHEDYTARVPVLTGEYSETELSEVFNLLTTLQQSEFLKAQIVEINRNGKGTYEIHPRFGDHVVIWGDATETEVKMKKLEAFYSRIVKKTGLDYYKKIDLRYKDQVVATKK